MRGRAMKLTELTLATLLCAALVAGAGCGGGEGAEPTSTPTISPSPIAGDTFEIYLVNTSNQSQVNYSNLDSIPLQDEPILSATDIVSYNWSSHLIELTDEGCARFEEVIPPEGYPTQSFLVVAYSERAYSGPIWSSRWSVLSSYHPPYPVSVYTTEDWGEDFKCNYSNTIEIACFYPFECKELRNSATIYHALKQAGILVE